MVLWMDLDIYVQFLCDNESCIDANYLCDNDNDCGDGSDEENCDSVSGSGEGGGEAESDPSERNNTAGGECRRRDQFQCSSGQCISRLYLISDLAKLKNGKFGCNPKLQEGSLSLESSS